MDVSLFSRRSVAASLTALVLAMAACASETGVAVGGGGAGDGAGDGGDGPGARFDDRGAAAGTSDAGAGATCAATGAKAERLPVHLVLVLDRSGSMCPFYNLDDPTSCDGSRWQQVTTALSGFFASPASGGLTVSLIAFPYTRAYCEASTYATPLEANVLLPDTAGTLANRMASVKTGGDTPTRPALEGAIGYAKALEAQLAGKSKVAIVLATDGLPTECSNNSVADAAAVAASVSATIPTYVIGVGQALQQLDTLAQGGGTGKALLVASQNITEEVRAALETVRGDSLACDYALPAPPAGRELDLDKVNVQITAGNGVASTLAFSADCTNPSGWRYDDAKAPTRIQLCAAACATARADAAAALDILLGCQTVGGGVK